MFFQNLKGKWKTVDIPSSVITAADSKFLGGIEVLSDYTVVKGDPISENSSLKRKKKENATTRSDCKKKCPTHQFGDDNIFESSLDCLSWENYHVPSMIARALLEEGLKYPTDIQRLCIPPAIKGNRDLFGAAKTGSGKTLAFGIPMITGVMNHLLSGSFDTKCDGNFNLPDDISCQESNERLWGLVLTPTRELAIQVKNHLEKAAKYTPVKITVIIGGMSSAKQERLLNKCPHIVVATPGRLWDLIDHPHLKQIEKIRYLVIDETDRMLEKEHFQELNKLLDKLNQNFEAKKLRQNFVFSATLTFVHDPPKHLFKRRKKVEKMTAARKLNNMIEFLGISNPKVVDLTNIQGVPETLVERKVLCSHNEKDAYLFYFLTRYPGRTLIFCNSISSVRWLTSLFGVLKLQPLSLHAEMHQRQRLKNLDRFRERSGGILIATEVAARGLDIPEVQHVVHFHVPRTTESYIHRSGRTARAEQEGLTLILIDPSEISLYMKLCNALGKSSDVPSFPTENILLNKIKKLMKHAKEVEMLEKSARVNASNVNWIRNAVKSMDIVIDEDEMPLKADQLEEAVTRKDILRKKAELMKLLGASKVIETLKQPFSAIDAAKVCTKSKNQKLLANII